MTSSSQCDSGRGLYVFFAVSPGGIGKFRLLTQDEVFNKVAQGFDLLANDRLSRHKPSEAAPLMSKKQRKRR